MITLASFILKNPLYYLEEGRDNNNICIENFNKCYLILYLPNLYSIFNLLVEVSFGKDMKKNVKRSRNHVTTFTITSLSTDSL